MNPLDVSSEAMDITKLKVWSEISPRDLPDASNFGNQEKIFDSSPFPFSGNLNKKVALWIGDMTQLNAHAIVNTTNEGFTDRSSLTQRILTKGGPQLRQQLKEQVKVCRTGDAKITKGFSLPARFVIHTVGPKYNQKYQTAAESALFSCYSKVLQLVRENGIKSIAIPPINTIRREYPPHEGAHIALRVVRRFLEKYGDDIDVIVFAVDDVNIGIYELLLPLYYPRSEREEEYALYYLPKDIGGDNGEPVIPERQIRILEKPVNAHKSADFEETVDLSSEIFEYFICD